VTGRLPFYTDVAFPALHVNLNGGAAVLLKK
jgi:hypothetical protein